MNNKNGKYFFFLLQFPNIKLRITYTSNYSYIQTLYNIILLINKTIY